MTEQSTSRALLLDLNARIGHMQSDIGKLVAGLGHVAERHKENIAAIEIIEKRLLDGSARHSEFAASLAAIEVKLEEIKPVTQAIASINAELSPLTVTVAEMKPKVDDLVDFKTRAAATVVASSAIMGTVAFFVWEGVKWFFPSAKDLFAKLFP
jgi:hypothetical protein